MVKDGGRLTLLHVTKAYPSVSRSGYYFNVPEYDRLLRQNAWQRMQDAVPVEARTRADVRARVVSGTPATEIVRLASEIDAAPWPVQIVDTDGDTTNVRLKTAQ
jgi:hypothetical protein